MALKQSHYCGSVGSVRGTLVLIVVLLFSLTRFNKEFAVSGLGMVFKFQRFQLALGSVVEQPIERGIILSKWATNSKGMLVYKQVGHQLKGECF